MSGLENRMSHDIRDLRAQNSAIRTDLKEFFKVQADFDRRLARIEDTLAARPAKRRAAAMVTAQSQAASA
jgi:hypothetical protein